MWTRLAAGRQRRPIRRLHWPRWTKPDVPCWTLCHGLHHPRGHRLLRGLLTCPWLFCWETACDHRLRRWVPPPSSPAAPGRLSSGRWASDLWPHPNLPNRPGSVRPCQPIRPNSSAISNNSPHMNHQSSHRPFNRRFVDFAREFQFVSINHDQPTITLLGRKGIGKLQLPHHIPFSFSYQEMNQNERVITLVRPHCTSPLVKVHQTSRVIDCGDRKLNTD